MIVKENKKSKQEFENNFPELTYLSYIKKIFEEDGKYNTDFLWKTISIATILFKPKRISYKNKSKYSNFHITSLGAKI